MKYCTHCGKRLADDVNFCDACGKRASDDSLANEKAFLEQTHRFLKYERLCDKIVGIFFLVFSLLFIGISILWLTLSFHMNFENGRLGMALMFSIYFIYGLIFLTLAVINLVMAKKVTKYMADIYTDPRPVLTRCRSVGLIVLATFFNFIALIFIIINFVRIKSNHMLVERIIARYDQQTV